MRIATYNIEWFTGLFSRDNRLLIDDEWSGRYNITRRNQLNALGMVFGAIDADAVMIIEAPNTSGAQSTTRSLEAFAAHFRLRQRKALVGFLNETEQEIALLYDPDKCDAFHRPVDDPAPRFDKSFPLDVDVDATPESIRFSKPPLEVALRIKGGPVVRLIGVHAKSKAPHGAKTDAEVVKISINNRRKQLAQCIWLRQRVDGHLEKGEPLIVLGDLNDGPGLDEYEELFGQSGVEIVLGVSKPAEQRLYDPHAHALITNRVGPVPSSARFYNHFTKRYLNALLDYVMVSPNLRGPDQNWKIWHPFDDPNCFDNADLSKALLTASDHFPVTLDLKF